MKSVINLTITIEHRNNLQGDARTIAADVAERVFDNFVQDVSMGSMGIGTYVGATPTPDGRGQVVQFGGDRINVYLQSAAVESKTVEAL